MAKPKTAGPTFLLRSDHPGDPYALIDSIGHNAGRAGSIGLADAAGRAAQAFLSWKKGLPAEEWLVTCDRISADRLATWAHRLEPIDATLCAEVRGVVEEMRQFLRLPAPGPSSTPTTATADNSLRIGQCDCLSGRSCERCLAIQAHVDAEVAKAQARRDATLAQERAQEHEREQRRRQIAEQRDQHRAEQRALITTPTLAVSIPGEAKPLSVFLNRLDDSGDVEAGVRTVGGLLRSLSLMQLPGITETHARLYAYEVTALRRELVALGVCDEAA